MKNELISQENIFAKKDKEIADLRQHLSRMFE